MGFYMEEKLQQAKNLQDGLFKNEQLVYEFWLVQNQTKQIIQKQEQSMNRFIDK
ncbi:unnamed protein product [Paramecium sonneborni]|uniref:Uncharacterized protein n=1 Tax=Paramecium sonneborni TaxID=65129 RepID=A0A8S1NS65_9CILI|nr:unnamed protein product [Paramecium sonneborni]